MGKTILYPFSLTDNNKDSFEKTLELANKLKAKVICMSVLMKEQTEDDAYLHLLKLNGMYQTNRNHWKTIPLSIEKQFRSGSLNLELAKTLLENTVDYIIYHKHLRPEQQTFVNNFILKNELSVGVVSIA